MGNVIPKFHFIIVICILFAFVPFSFSESKRDSKRAQISRDKGYEAQRLGNLDLALSFYQRAVDFDPYYAVAYNDLGVVLEAKGMNDRAKEVYLRAISLDPNYLSAYYNLAALYEREGEYDKADYYWRMRVHLGDWSDVWTWRAKESLEGLEREGKIDSKSRTMVGDLGFRLTPNPKRNAEYHTYQGRQYLAAGNYLAALREFSAAIAIDPYDEEIEQLLENTQLKVLLNR